MRWEPSEVKTVDGRSMLSNSNEWLRYCEALTIAKSPDHLGARYWAMIEKMRGPEGKRAIEDEIRRIEPAYALSLPSKEARQAYLFRVEAARGVSARKALEQSIVELWRQRQAAAEVPA